MLLNENKETKTVGVIRRVDDLGRIVIPKEIRQTLGIVEGTPMELFVSEDGIYIKKHLLKASVIDMVRSLSEVVDSTDMEFGPDNTEKIQDHIQEIWKLLK